MFSRLKNIDYKQFYAFFIILSVIPGSLGYMAWEADHAGITVLEIEGAPKSVVLIGDPHIHEGNIKFIRDSVRTINSLKPSVVLIAGDFVNGEEPDLSLQDVWSEIDAPVYAVLGNHDYESGVDGISGQMKRMAVAEKTNLTVEGYDVSMLFDETTDLEFGRKVEEKLEENGVNVLRNEYVTINAGGEEMLLVGIDDGWAGLSNPPKDFPDTDAFTLYMIHEPSCRAEWPNADLIVAGHTHGGQISPPVVQALNENGIVELAGFVGDGVPTYVTRGLGSAQLLGVDVRYQSPPEIVIINPAEDTAEIIDRGLI